MNGSDALMLVLFAIVGCCGYAILLVVVIVLVRWHMIRTEEHGKRLVREWADEQGLQLLDHRSRGWALLMGPFEVTVRDVEGQVRRGMVRVQRDPRSFWPKYRAELRQWEPEPEPPSQTPDVRDDPLWDRWLDSSS